MLLRGQFGNAIGLYTGVAASSGMGHWNTNAVAALMSKATPNTHCQGNAVLIHVYCRPWYVLVHSGRQGTVLPGLHSRWEIEQGRIRCPYPVHCRLFRSSGQPHVRVSCSAFRYGLQVFPGFTQRVFFNKTAYQRPGDMVQVVFWQPEVSSVTTTEGNDDGNVTPIGRSAEEGLGGGVLEGIEVGAPMVRLLVFQPGACLAKSP